MNSRKSTEMSTDAIQYIDTPSSAAALNTIEKKNQIHFDRSIDSEWLEENQIPKKNRSAAQSMSIFTNALAVDDDAEPF